MNKTLLIIIGSGLAVVIIAGSVFFFSGDKDTPKEGKNSKPTTTATVPTETKNGSERGNEIEKPVNVEKTGQFSSDVALNNYLSKIYLHSQSDDVGVKSKQLIAGVNLILANKNLYKHPNIGVSMWIKNKGSTFTGLNSDEAETIGCAVEYFMGMNSFKYMKSFELNGKNANMIFCNDSKCYKIVGNANLDNFKKWDL